VVVASIIIALHPFLLAAIKPGGLLQRLLQFQSRQTDLELQRVDIRAKTAFDIIHPYIHTWQHHSIYLEQNRNIRSDFGSFLGRTQMMVDVGRTRRASSLQRRNLTQVLSFWLGHGPSVTIPPIAPAIQPIAPSAVCTCHQVAPSASTGPARMTTYSPVTRKPRTKSKPVPGPLRILRVSE